MSEYVTLRMGGPISAAVVAALAGVLDAARFEPGRDSIEAAVQDGRLLTIEGEAWEGDFAAVEAFCVERGVLFHRVCGESSALLDAGGFLEESCLDGHGNVLVTFEEFVTAHDHSARAVWALRDRLARHAADPPPMTLVELSE